MGILLATLKLFGLLLQGISGGIALLVNFKDPVSHKITKWGWRALVGVILGTLISLGSFVVEQSLATQNLEAASRTARETMDNLKLSVTNSEVASTKSQESAAKSDIAAQEAGKVTTLASEQLRKADTALLEMNRAMHAVDSMTLAFRRRVSLANDEYLSDYTGRLRDKLHNAPINFSIADVRYREAFPPPSGLVFVSDNWWEIFPDSGLFPDPENELAAWSRVHDYSYVLRFYKKPIRPVDIGDNITEWDTKVPADLMVVFNYEPEDEKTLRLLYAPKNKKAILFTRAGLQRSRNSWLTNGTILGAPDFANSQLFLQVGGLDAGDVPDFALKIGNDFELVPTNFKRVKSLANVYLYRFPKDAIGAAYTQRQKINNLHARLCIKITPVFTYDSDDMERAIDVCNDDVRRNKGRAPERADLTMGVWGWTNVEDEDFPVDCGCWP